MPGMYGAVGCQDPRALEALRSGFERVWGGCERLDGDGWMLGGHAFGGRRALGTRDGRPFAVDGERSVYRCASAARGETWSARAHGDLRLDPAFRGNLALLEPETGTLRLALEASGTFPLYLARYAGGVLFSSLQRPLARAIGAAPDELGVLEFLRQGLTFGARSLFAGVRRLQPGQCVRYRAADDAFEVRETSDLWVGSEQLGTAEAAERAWELLGRALEGGVGDAGRVALMMSAGWDSRTLLAALTPHAAGRLSCYAHGDLHSRELRLVERLCRVGGAPARLEPIDARAYDLARLQHGFDRVENVIFPYWHRAGALHAEAGVDCVVAGVYGEVLGGHYGEAMLLRGHRKLRSVALALLGRPSGSRDGATMDDVGHLLRPRGAGRHWYLSESFERSVDHAADRIGADVDADLARLRDRGVATPHQLLEAFIAEHRGTQYINAQLLSCRAQVDVALPFAHAELLAFASRLPIHVKVHNRLNRAMLGRHARQLLRQPMAATLVPASAPLVLQEASRLARSAYETGRWSANRRSRGRLPPPRLGWVFFEFMRSAPTLHDLIDDLRTDVWDREALHHRVAANLSRARMEPLHPLCDQLSKVYTVDLMLRAEA